MHGDAAVTVNRRWPPPADPRCLITYIAVSRSKNFSPPFHSILFPCRRARSALHLSHATQHRLARALATRALIPSTLSFAKGSRCFSTRFCSSIFTLPTPTLDPVSDFHRPPMSSFLLAFHCRPSGA
jgi:hypothetical protein